MPDPWKNNGWGEGKTRPDQKAKAAAKAAVVGALKKPPKKTEAERILSMVDESDPTDLVQSRQNARYYKEAREAENRALELKNN